eukprot:7401305-Lingulodinium_polyedra.AAC.1
MECMDCPWAVRAQFMENPWIAHGLPTVCPCTIHGQWGCPWIVHGRSMRNRWCVRGQSVGNPWTVHGLSMDCPWDVQG